MSNLLDGSKIDVTRFTGVILSAETVVYGNFMFLDKDTNHIKPGVPAEGDIPIGVLESVTANYGVAADLVGDGTKEATCLSKIILKNLTVTGVTSALDIKKPVYLTAANAFTIVKPAVGLPVGHIHYWSSGTTVDVYVNGLEEAAASSGAGSREVVSLGNFSTLATGLEAANALSLSNLIKPTACKIISLHAQASAYDAGSVAGDQDFTLEIDGVATTGGVLSLGFANNDAVGDMGVAVDATAITALNDVPAGSTIELTMIAGGTGFTASKAGRFSFYAVIENV